MDGQPYPSLNRNINDGSPEAAHILYEKEFCHQKTGVPAGMTSLRYLDCLKGEGLEFVYNTPAQITAQQQAQHDVATRAWLYSAGQALAGAATTMNPPIVTCRHLYGGVTQCQ